MTDLDNNASEEGARDPRSLAAFAQAVIVLVGVFYFINAACKSSSSDDSTYVPTPVCSGTPPTLSIVDPDGGELRGVADVDGKIEVQVQVGIEGGTTDCRPAYLHVVASPDILACQAQLQPQQATIPSTTRAGTLHVAPGSYELAVTALDVNGEGYEEPVTASVHINVFAALSDGGLLDGAAPCAEGSDGAIP